ncbi:MAG TPA: 3'(2'),5'-bisphosphate nucleotidase [Abditibacteriaceae bacterium]|jgi:3'(2'), 5'-bisphosphate nucleotidase
MSLERETGLRAVQSAARLCQQVRVAMVSNSDAAKLDKSDKSPVTVADFGAQAVVCKIIAEQFPNDAIVGEEGSAALREAQNEEHLQKVVSFVNQQIPGDAEEICNWIDKGAGEAKGRYWVLDPIDGTKGFLRNDQYAVALALIENGQVQWGFLACPALPNAQREGSSSEGSIFVAQRGAGAKMFSLDGDDSGTIQVSTQNSVAKARLAESVESAHTNQGLAAQLRERLSIDAPPVRMDSQAKYAAVARGDAEIYLRSPNSRTPDYRENIWDHAAGYLVVEEAGGRVTDVRGNPLDWSQGKRLENNLGVLATNGLLHDEVVKVLKTLL